jgi:hypothetical protein
LTYDDSSSIVVDLQDTVDEELFTLTGDSDTVKDFGEVVRDETVTGPLREKGDSDNNPHSLEITLSLEQGDVGRLCLGLLFDPQSFLDFLVFELDQWVVRVSSTMVLSNDMDSVLVSTMIDEPSRGFGDEPDEDELDCRSKSLQD